MSSSIRHNRRGASVQKAADVWGAPLKRNERKDRKREEGLNDWGVKYLHGNFRSAVGAGIPRLIPFAGTPQI